MPKTICIYHAHCIDGFTAAWVVRLSTGPDTVMIPASYSEAPPDVTGAKVYIVDFSYPREALARMSAQAKSMVVLDHHQSAEQALRGLILPNTTIRFDMTRSGAGLAWQWFYAGGELPPLLVDYVEDRDLWRFALSDSRAINAYIANTDRTFEAWDQLAADLEEDASTIAEAGESLLRQHARFVAAGCDMTLRYMQIGGHRVPVANLPAFLASEAGNLLAEGNPFAAVYHDSPTGRKFSLRSTDAGQDVAKIAQSYGGSGHRNAAGFQMPIGWEGDR